MRVLGAIAVSFGGGGVGLGATATSTASAPVGADKVRFRPGKGLAVASADGRFSLNARVRGQVRYTSRSGDDDAGHQFNIRRARVVLGGHFFGEENSFKLELAVSPNDLGISDNLAPDVQARAVSNSPLLDLYFDFRHLRDLGLRVGQYKLPSNRTRVISSGDLQLVDRSIVNSEFTLDRDVGLDFRSRDLLGLGLLRYYAGASIGRGRDSQGFDDLGLNYFGRIEVLPFGFFDDYKEADLSRDPAPRLSIGLGYVFQDRSRGLRRIVDRQPADGGTVTQHVGYADLVYKQAGLSVLIESAVRLGSRNRGGELDETGAPEPVTPPRDGWGASLQAGFLFGFAPIEVAGRASVVRGLGDASETSLEDRTEVGGGLSWYIAGHPYKVQADVFHVYGARWSDGETQLRVQLQAGL